MPDSNHHCKHSYFTIDFDDFAKKAADPLVKLVLWCNPHNPSGRMWTEEELKRVAEIVEKHNLWLISDEIHCDIIRNGRSATSGRQPFRFTQAR